MLTKAIKLAQSEGIPILVFRNDRFLSLPTGVVSLPLTALLIIFSHSVFLASTQLTERLEEAFLVLELEVQSKLFILTDLKLSHNAAVSRVLTSHAVSKMAVAVSMFRWLDLLEKEFDKTFVDLDILLGEIDPDQSEITYDGRQKMTQLSSSFAQLVHKAQTIFQGNAKLEVSLKINFKTSIRVQRITC